MPISEVTKYKAFFSFNDSSPSALATVIIFSRDEHFKAFLDFLNVTDAD